MKNTLYLFLWMSLMPFYTLYAQEIDIEKRNKDLAGYWMIEDKGVLVIESNGEIRLEVNGEVINTGNWKLSEDGSIFYILEEDDIRETMEIIRVNEQEFSFHPDLESAEVVTLTKVDKASVTMPEETTVTERGSLSSEDITKRKKLLIGSWILEGSSMLVIKEDGTIQEKKEGEVHNSGTWKLSEVGNTFLIFEEGNLEEEITIVDVTSTQFIMETPDKTQLTLFKEKALSQDEIKARQKQIIGTWEANTIDVRAVENPDISLIIEIKKGGVFNSSNGDDFDKSGNWTLSKDGNYLNISGNGEDKQTSRIISLSQEELLLLTGSKTVSFTRIK